MALRWLSDAPNVWWVGLLNLTRLLCAAIDRAEGKLPSDMPSEVVAMFPYVRAACLALKLYDRTHKRGS